MKLGSFTSHSEVSAEKCTKACDSTCNVVRSSDLNLILFCRIRCCRRRRCLSSLFRRSLQKPHRIERFSFECRKVIGFALSTRCDWLKRFAPPFHPIRSKTKANCDALACIFPRFASATCNYFEF